MNIKIDALIRYFIRRLKTRTLFNHCIVNAQKIKQFINILHSIQSIKTQNSIFKTQFTSLSDDNTVVRYKAISSALLPATTQKKVLILGWYGAGNYGDELMLHTLISRPEFHNCVISILLDPYFHYPLNTYKNLNCYFPPLEYNEIPKLAAYFDEIIVGGGAHIDDSIITDLSFIPFISLELSTKAIQANKIVRWISVSAISELTNIDYIKKLQFIAAHAKEFSLRDRYSISVLSRCSIKDVSFNHDIAFDYDFSKKTIILTLVPFAREDILLSIIHEVNQFISESCNSWRVCFLPFFVGNDHDATFVQNVLAKTACNLEYTVLQNFTNIESMFPVMKGADVFINMRYHASLISLKLNKPTITFCVDSHPHYYNKMKFLSTDFPKNIFILESSYKKGDVLSALRHFYH